jgi:hypothetical protein
LTTGWHAQVLQEQMQKLSTTYALIPGTPVTKWTIGTDSPCPMHHDYKNWGMTWVLALVVDPDNYEFGGHVIVSIDGEESVVVEDSATSVLAIAGIYSTIYHGNFVSMKKDIKTDSRFKITFYTGLDVITRKAAIDKQGANLDTKTWAAAGKVLKPELHCLENHGAPRFAAGKVVPTDNPAQAPLRCFPQLTRLSLARCDSAPSAKLSGSSSDQLQHSYWILASANSQYGIGAVSACTNMACTAAHAILNHLANSCGNDSRPFGCTIELIKTVLTDAGTYASAVHQSTIDVLRTRPDLCKSSWSMDGGGGRYGLFIAHATVVHCILHTRTIYIYTSPCTLTSLSTVGIRRS